MFDAQFVQHIENLGNGGPNGFQPANWGAKRASKGDKEDFPPQTLQLGSLASHRKRLGGQHSL